MGGNRIGTYGTALSPTPARTQVVDPRRGDFLDPALRQLQAMRQWMGPGYPIIPCSTGGTVNAIVLTPLLLPAYGASGYATLLPFAFVAAGTSTGTVTVQVQRDSSHQLDALPAYVAGSAAGSGDVVEDVAYFALYCDEGVSLPERFALK